MTAQNNHSVNPDSEAGRWVTITVRADDLYIELLQPREHEAAEPGSPLDRIRVAFMEAYVAKTVTVTPRIREHAKQLAQRLRSDGQS